MHKLKVVKI